jgi:glycosyltransferase involved in cell wall biosynthesis
MYGEKYKSLSIYSDMEQLYASIRTHKDADLFHCHNEPSWFVTAVKQVLGDKPAILDVHDSMLVRVKPEEEGKVRISIDERNNFQLADGLVFVNEPMANFVRDEFKLPQPWLALPSYVPIQFYRIDPFQYLGGVVYEGRVDLPTELSKEMEFFSYCDYTKLADQFKEAGVAFNIYTPRKDKAIQEHYKDRAAWQGSHEYHNLIRKIGRHDWGLVGNVDKHPAWEMALPNKLFEYIAAGVPVVCMNAPVAGELVEKHGVGIHVESVDELKRRWKEHRVCRRNVALKGHSFCMENHIGGLESLYEDVLNANA